MPDTTQPTPEKPPPPDDAAIDAWIERRIATIREDAERMREVRKATPWQEFTPPF